MDEFKNLTRDWRNIPAGNAEIGSAQNGKLMEKIKKHQRRILLGNMVMSISFAGTFMVFAWIYTHFTEHGAVFYNSILSIAALMVVTLVLAWNRVLFWRRIDFSDNVNTFTQRIIKKLRFTLWMEKVFMPFYLALLALGLTFYLTEALKETRLWIRAGALGLTYVWIFGFGFYSRNRYRKKQGRRIEALLKEMEEVRETLK